MSEKELGVKVTGDIADISTALDQLAEQINNFNDKDVNLNVTINDSGLDQLDTRLENAGVSMEALADKSELAGETINTSLAGATDGVKDVTQAASEAGEAITETGDASTVAAESIESSMDGAVLAVAAVGAAAELSAQQLYQMGYTAEQIGTYTGIGVENAEELVSTLSSASFPREAVEDYLVLLDQLGVPQDKLKANAEALNEITLGTKTSAEEGTRFATAIKVLGGNVEELASYYGLAAYAQDKTVGGLANFDKIATAIGPRLTAMGLDAEESAVIIAAASQKYGGNMRQIRKAITDADGDVNKLADSLGVQRSELDNAGATMTQYSGNLHEVAQAGREAHTPLEETSVSIQDIGAQARDVLIPLAELAAVIGGGFGIVTVGTKMLDTFGFTENASSKWAELVKTNLGKAKTYFSDFGSEALNSIKGWSGWPDEIARIFNRAGSEMKIPTTDITAGLDDAFAQMSGKAAQAEEVGRGLGGKIINGIKGILPKSVDDLLGTVLKGSKFESGMLFTKEDFVGEEGSQKRTSWEEVLKGWGLGKEDLRKWNDEMNKGPLEDAKSNTQALKEFLTTNLSGASINWGTVFGSVDLGTVVNSVKTDLGLVQTDVGGFLDWTGVIGTYDSAKGMWDRYVTGFDDSLPNINTAIGEVESTIGSGLQFLEDLPSKAWQWGWDTIDSWRDGIGNRLEGTKEWLEEKLNPITSILEGHSPPKEGPLKDIDIWGENIGQSFVEGIGRGIGLNTSFINDALNSMSNAFTPNSYALPQATTKALQTSGAVFPVTINISLPAMSSVEEAKEYGDAAGHSAGQSFAEVLQGQASDAGVNVYNVRR